MSIIFLSRRQIDFSMDFAISVSSGSCLLVNKSSLKPSARQASLTSEFNLAVAGMTVWSHFPFCSLFHIFSLSFYICHSITIFFAISLSFITILFALSLCHTLTIFFAICFSIAHKQRCSQVATISLPFFSRFSISTP